MSSPEPVRPETRHSRRGPVPMAAALVTGALALQGAALVWLAVEVLTHLTSGVLPTQAKVFLAVAYTAVAAWIAATAGGIWRGRAWARGATTAVELFGVFIACWLVSLGASVLGIALLVVSGAALIALFTGSVTRHLGGAAR